MAMHSRYALLTPEGKPAVSDNLVESKRISFKLPKSWAGRKLVRVLKDSVRLGVRTGTLEARPAESHSLIEDLLTPSSLTAHIEESSCFG